MNWRIDSMCTACGPGQTHVDVTPPALPPPARFGALRNRDCRNYLGGGLLSMAADNVEQHIGEYSRKISD
jgi:hypothetical protein